MVFVVSLVAQVKYSPYSIGSLNFLESATLASSSLVLQAGSMAFAGGFTVSQREILGFVILSIVGLSASLVLFVLIKHLGNSYKDYKNQEHAEAMKKENLARLERIIKSEQLEDSVVDGASPRVEPKLAESKVDE